MSVTPRVVAWISPFLGTRVASSVLAAAARVGSPVLPASRIIAARNARCGLPKGLEGETVGNLGRYLGEFFSLAGSRERVRALTGRVDVEEARKTLAAGRAVITVTPHFGNWEMGALILREEFGPVSVIIRTTGDPELDRAIRICRGENELLDVADGARGVIEALARPRNDSTPRILAAAIDEPRSEGIEVSFMGRTARFPPGLFRAAVRANAAVHPTRCRRNAEGKIDFEIFAEAGSPQETASVFESWIREDPTQWVLTAATY